MSTQLLDFSCAQGALVIFQDDQPGTDAVETHLQTLFLPQEYLYLKGAGLAGTELVRFVQEQVREQYVTLPRDGRMIFCRYLPLADLTEEWVEGFFETAGAVRRFLPPGNVFDQHYMICFSYETGTFGKEDWDRILPLLHKLALVQKDELSHQIYLLRSVGVETLESQEQGFVQLVHLLSRKDYYKACSPMDMYSSFLKMVTYTDFYENRVANCRDCLAGLNQWLEGENDPEFTKLLTLLRYQLQGAVNSLRRAVSGFGRRIGLYPARVTDFTGNFITGYRSTVSENHKMIRERRKEFIRNACADLAGGVSLDEAVRLIGEEYTWRDGMRLKEALEKGDLSRLMLEGIDRKEDEEEALGRLIESITDRFRERTEAWLSGLEDRRRDREREIRRCKKELSRAGTYETLEECLQMIDEDTKPPMLSGKFAEHTNTVTLISGKSLEKWRSRMYCIRNVPTAYRYSRKDEDMCEIALVKESDMTDLTDEGAVGALRRMFGGE